MPKEINRRNLFGRGAIAFSGLAIGAMIGSAIPLPSTAAGSDGDAGIIALCAEVLRLNAVADKIAEDRILPFDDEFYAILKPERGVRDWDARAERAFAFS